VKLQDSLKREQREETERHQAKAIIVREKDRQYVDNDNHKVTTEYTVNRIE
jgi:hypothetical protein